MKDKFDQIIFNDLNKSKDEILIVVKGFLNGFEKCRFILEL